MVANHVLADCEKPKESLGGIITLKILRVRVSMTENCLDNYCKSVIIIFVAPISVPTRDHRTLEQ